MGERTRIRRIRVSKLFGIFDHEIPLNMSERITIVHGPNGFGKTVILQMVDGLFSGRREALRRVPFEELAVELEDGGLVSVKHGADEPGLLALSYTAEPNAAPFVYMSSESYPGDSRDPGWVKALPQRLALRLIHTRRLGAIGDQAPAVSTYSVEMATSIKSVLATYASRSQELDSTFLDRLLQQGKEPPPPLANIHERLLRIEQKRAQLMGLGFLDAERDPHRRLPQLDESKRDVLSIYVEDTEGKLAVFDEMARKVQLLTDAINKRFKYKRMSVSKETGFVFTSTVDSTPVPIVSLSSGEQHELVLFYELLFKVEPDTLVLIDEPEISLHLVWQRQFLDDLTEIVRLSNFDVLIATHAPAIIGKRWDLTVSLEGPALHENAAQ